MSWNTKAIQRPPLCAELAEFLGAIMGDGNIHRYVRPPKVATYMVRIAGHDELDLEYLQHHVKPLAENLFGIKGTVRHHTREDFHSTYLMFHSKELVDFLEEMGGVVGNKTRQEARIPAWVLTSTELLSAYLRGLYDTDGSVFRMSRQDPKLLRISFTSASTSLMSDVRCALLHLGFHPNKPTDGGVRLNLSRQAEVRRFLKEIGFANAKHKQRLALLTQPRGVEAN